MLGQIGEITLMNLRNLPSRLGLSSVIVVGIAGVVAVLVGLLSMASGFTEALESAGRADRAILMRDATNNELDLETVAPVVTVDPLITNDNTPQLTGTVDDPTAVVEVTVNGNTYLATNNGDGTWTLPDDTIAALGDLNTIASSICREAAPSPTSRRSSSRARACTDRSPRTTAPRAT